MLGLLLGIPLGVLSSLLAWWVLFHAVTPKIRFAEKISRLSFGDGKTFRLKLLNDGRRHIIDCEFVAELRVRGLSPGVPRNTWLIRIPLRNDGFAYWPRGTNRLIVFMPYRPDARVAAFCPADEDEGLALDRLFAIRDEVHLRIIVFAYDSFSGSRRVFVSKDYSASDIADGRYSTGSLGIEPKRETPTFDDEVGPDAALAD